MPLIQRATDREVQVRDFAFIVPAFNEEELLPKTLDNLNAIVESLKNSYSGRIIVVDNNSTDTTAQIASDKGAKVYFEPENRISKARNTGAGNTDVDFLVFVDADTVPSVGLVENTLALLDSGLVCGGGAETRFDTPLPFLGKLTLAIWNLYSKLFLSAAGSYLFCSQEAWLDIGGFDESLYASEEIDFSAKLRKWGKKRGMRFERLAGSVTTSARKLQWYSPTVIFAVLCVSAICPPLLKSKKWCRKWWYSRPQNI